MDQFSRVMTTMTGSQEKANSALEKTNQIVSGTAYGLDTAAKGVQAFVASGMEVTKATDTMGAWADAVSFYTKGTNVELETVSMALQKMGTKGNVTMEHLQMLLEAGIPAIQIYASAVGVSTEEVTAAMSRGELKTSDFIGVMNQAFQTGTTGFPSVAGAAKQAGASWAGSISNMNAATARGTASILTAFDKVFDIKGGMVSFGKGVESVLKGLSQNLDKVAIAAVGMATAFGTAKIMSMVSTWLSAVAKGSTTATAAINLLTLAKTKEEIVTVAQMASESGLTAAQGIRSVIMGVLTGQISFQTAATFALKIAQDALNKSMLANPIVLILSLIAMLIVAIVQAATRTNEEAEKIKAETEAIKQEQEQLTEAAAQSAVEYEKNVAAIANTAERARVLADQLFALSDIQDRNAEQQATLRSVTAELVKLYPELSKFVDQNTGIIIANNDAVKQAIDGIIKQNTLYDVAMEKAKRGAELTTEREKAEIALGQAKEKVAQQTGDLTQKEKERDEAAKQSSDIYSKLNDGTMRTAEETAHLQSEYNRLIGVSDNARISADALRSTNDDLTNGFGDLEKSVESAKKEEDEFNKERQIAVDAAVAGYKSRLVAVDQYQKTNKRFTEEEIAEIQSLIDAGASLTDTERENFIKIVKLHQSETSEVKKMAHQYGVSAESIVDDLDYIEGGAEAYAAKMEKSFTKNGYSLEEIAKKWGMTTDQVSGYMDEWGMTLDELDEELSNSVNDQGETLDDLAAKWGTTKEELRQMMVNEDWGLQDLSDRVADTSEDIINDWGELPTKYEKSLDEMMRIARENAAKYAEWKSKMVFLSQNLSSESIAALTELGVGGMSVIDELIAGGAPKWAEFNATMATVTAVSVQDMLNQFGALPPNVVEQFNLVNESVGLKIDEMGVITDIKTGAVVSAFDASMRRLTPSVIDAFNEMNIGTGIALDATGAIVDTKTNAVIATAQEVFASGALDAAVNDEWDKVAAILQQNPSVQNAMRGNAEGAASGAGDVLGSADFERQGSQSQDSIARGIAANNTPVQAAQKKAQDVTQAFKTEFESTNFISILSNAISKMAEMVAVNTALIAATGGAVRGARTEGEKESNTGWGTLGLNIVQGVANSVMRNAGILAGAIKKMIQQGLAAGREEAEVNSPSKLFGRKLGLAIPEGVGAYVEKGTPDAIRSVQNMIDEMARVGTTGYNVNIMQDVAAARQAQVRISTNAPNVAERNALLMEQNQLLRDIRAKNPDVYLGMTKVGTALEKWKGDRGAQISKGVFRNEY